MLAFLPNRTGSFPTHVVYSAMAERRRPAHYCHMMFSAFCPTHDATVLMTRRNAIGVEHTENGTVLRWRCNCGDEGTLDRNGSHADAAPAMQSA